MTAEDLGDLVRCSVLVDVHSREGTISFDIQPVHHIADYESSDRALRFNPSQIGDTYRLTLPVIETR